MTQVNKTRNTQKSEQQNKKILTNNNNPLLIIIVFVFLALIIVGIFCYPWLKDHFNSSNTTTITELAPLDTIPAIDEPFIIEQEESLPSIPKGYYIIIGSFRYKDNAESLVNHYSNRFHLEILFFEELGLYRVSIGYYDNALKAYTNVLSVKDFEAFWDAWVLENI